jgi:calcineurin-like phosphoesterase family protein
MAVIKSYDFLIHGHHHNNFPSTYHFYNSLAKTFNVSVELAKFKPVPLSTILGYANIL